VAFHRLAQFTVTDLPFADASFDAAVCFGSVLSNVDQQALPAMRELVRVVRNDGLILVSVQPPRLQPSHGNDLAYLLHAVRKFGLAAADDLVLHSRELPEESAIPWRAFSRQEIESMAAGLSCEINLLSASNVLATITSIPVLEDIEKDDRLWQAFLRWEEHLASQPGNIEGGSHIIAVLRKRDSGHG
jgi:SAM-dependent methyltransferase